MPEQPAGPLTGALAMALALFALATYAPRAQAQEQKLQAVTAEQAAADKAAAAAQDRIDKIHDETQDMVSQYRQALADADSYKAYSEQLSNQIKAQNEEIASINRQLTEVESTGRDIWPLMQKMVDTLEQFVALDVPFLLDERRARVANLKGMMERADVSISEKYRRIVEAYQIEMEYGRTLDSYEALLGEGQDSKKVELLRVGRVALLYQTPDGRETGYWDRETKQWVRDDDYRSAVREGLRVAKKVGAPDLLTLPVPAPKEVQS
jgi:hypothetical protein